MEQLTKVRKMKNFRRYLPLLLMSLPGMLYLFLNNYLPMFGITIAFKDMSGVRGIFGGQWIGLKNFQFLFSTSDAFIITRNTILYNGGFIIINTVVGVGVAILLNEVKNTFCSRFYQSLVLLPYLISMVVVSYLVFAFLSMESGFVNKSILPLFHINSIAWYTESKYWPFILTFVNTWKQIGFQCVIYLASIIGIDKEYYEAATIDGASKWKQVLHITLPSIKPVIIMLVLLGIGRIFYSDFGLFYQVPMNSGSLYDTTNVIDTYVYRGLLQLGDVGMSSAAGLYQAVVGFVLVVIANYTVRKIDKDSALF